MLCFFGLVLLLKVYLLLKDRRYANFINSAAIFLLPSTNSLVLAIEIGSLFLEISMKWCLLFTTCSCSTPFF